MRTRRLLLGSLVSPYTIYVGFNQSDRALSSQRSPDVDCCVGHILVYCWTFDGGENNSALIIGAFGRLTADPIGQDLGSSVFRDLYALDHHLPHRILQTTIFQMTCPNYIGEIATAQMIMATAINSSDDVFYGAIRKNLREYLSAFATIHQREMCTGSSLSSLTFARLNSGVFLQVG